MIITKVSRYCLRNLPSLIFRRYSGAYEGSGETTITIINDINAKVHLIKGYSQLGFRLTNESFVMGPMIIVRDKVFFWDIGHDENINEASLEFFYHLHPLPDLLIVGYSDVNSRPKMNQHLQLIGRKHGLQMEVLPTVKAVGTYNFLAEIRNVAGAFIPPLEYHYDSVDRVRALERMQEWDIMPSPLVHEKIPIKFFPDEPEEKADLSGKSKQEQVSSKDPETKKLK